MTAVPDLDRELVLARARDYVARGFSVIPLRPGGKKPPQGWSWGEYQKRFPTDEELVEWFSRPANIAIVTGVLSGLTVIDCDSPEVIQYAATLGLPTSPQVKTSRGRHFYYAYQPGVTIGSAMHGVKGLDWRGEGGFVVAPPSVHECVASECKDDKGPHPVGAVYTWDGEDRPLPRLPTWAHVDSGRRANRPPRTNITGLYRGVEEGSRNDSLARLAGMMAPDVPIDFATQIALIWNTQNRPPLTESEVVETVRSIYRTEAKNRRRDITMEVGGSFHTAAVSPSSGIVRVADLEEKLKRLYIDGLQPGVSTGFPSIDGTGQHNRLYSIRKGELTIVTGIPSHGKSSVLDQLLVQVAKLHGWKFAVFSGENRPTENHVAGLMEKLLERPFNDGPTARITLDDFTDAMKWLNEFVYFLEPDAENQNLATIMALAGQLVDSDGISAVILDPWNELNHIWPAGTNETTYISGALSSLKRFARARNVHVFVLAHPHQLKKENGKYPVPTAYDISGSAHWRNKADNVLSIFRSEVDGSSDTNTVFVQKIRFREVGKIGNATFEYDTVVGRFVDRVKWSRK